MKIRDVLVCCFLGFVFAAPAFAAEQPFVGQPKTRAQLIKCEEVVSTYSRKVYERGDKVIATMLPKWALCRSAKKEIVTVLPTIQPQPVQADVEARAKLALEATNMTLYGNPFGPIQKIIAPTPQPTTQPIPQSVQEIPQVSALTVSPLQTPSASTFQPAKDVPTPSITITVISPIAGKGIGRQYVASSTVLDESNYVAIGAVLTDQNGNQLNTPTVTVTCTDTTQNKTLVGTGNYTKTSGWYYPFYYEFHTSGIHTITFSSGGATVSVNLQVQ